MVLDFQVDSGYFFSFDFLVLFQDKKVICIIMLPWNG